MTITPTATMTRDITVDEVFPHAPETIWRTLTTEGLIGRWLMEPRGFEPVVGNCFTFQTTSDGAWDGVIDCEILEVVPNERFAFAWRGGHPDNKGYGSRLDTIVTWTLEKTLGGTHVRVVHSGFELPKNEAAFSSMSQGWIGVVDKVRMLSAATNA